MAFSLLYLLHSVSNIYFPNNKMKKIIIADDNKTFLMYLGLLLKRFDFKVIPAENGLEVLRLLRLAHADIVILDVHMKMMDGLTVLRHIKEDRQTSHIPVIMLSSDSNSELIDKCKQLGCFDYLRKPLKVDQLHDAVQRCFFSHMGTNRRHLRVHYKEKVVVAHNGTRLELYTETLSEGGMYIRKEEPLPVGSEVKITCPLGDRGSIELTGKVIYTKKLFGDFLTLPPGMAIVFNGLTEEDSKSLKLFIEDVIAKDIFESQQDKLFEH